MTKALISHIEYSINNANSGISKLNAEVLQIDGMSSVKNRHLLNNLLNIPEVNYLEIGVYKGSTFVSALYENDFNTPSTIYTGSAYAVDNWSEFTDAVFDEPTKEIISAEFIENCRKFEITDFTLLEDDCFNVSLQTFKHKINVYFYDGHHSLESTCKAISYYYEVLADEFILIVDDFDWPGPQDGIAKGISDCGLKTLYHRHLKANCLNDKDSWWNGIGIFILKK